MLLNILNCVKLSLNYLRDTARSLTGSGIKKVEDLDSIRTLPPTRATAAKPEQKDIGSNVFIRIANSIAYRVGLT
jgi:hypothetical protein